MEIVKKQEWDIEVVAAEIRSLTHQAKRIVLGFAIEIGRRLCEAKEMVPHGEWGKWLEEKVQYSKSTANNFMRLFQEYGGEQLWLFEPEANSQTLGNLNYTKALRLLAIPEEERESFAKENDVENLSTRELDKLIKERDEARQVAEEAKNIANGYAVKLDFQREEAAKAAREAAAEADKLREQLEALEKRPIEVAVETVVDQAAIDAAREEERQKLQAKLDKAEKAKTAAMDAKVKAEQALKEAMENQEKVRKAAKEEKAAFDQQVEGLRKKLAVASSSEVAIFKLHFEQGQGSVGKMLDCIRKLKEEGDADSAAKLRKALKAFLTKSLEALQ